MRPEAVVFPRSTRASRRSGQALRTARCVGGRPRRRNQSGRRLPASAESGDAVVLMLTRMNRILEIDLRNRMAVVEAGVANLRLTAALAGTGYHFAPDPSSQGASTIGGNVATNAGGPHTLKYGVTVNHVLGLEVVLSRRLDPAAWARRRPGRARSDRRVGRQRRHARHRDESLGPPDAQRRKTTAPCGRRSTRWTTPATR